MTRKALLWKLPADGQHAEDSVTDITLHSSRRSSPLNVLLSDYLTDGEVANSTVHWEADSDSHVDDALAVGNHGTLCPGTRQMKKRNDVTRREVDQMQLRVCPQFPVISSPSVYTQYTYGLGVTSSSIGLSSMGSTLSMRLSRDQQLHKGRKTVGQSTSRPMTQPVARAGAEPSYSRRTNQYQSQGHQQLGLFGSDLILDRKAEDACTCMDPSLQPRAEIRDSFPIKIGACVVGKRLKVPAPSRTLAKDNYCQRSGLLPPPVPPGSAMSHGVTQRRGHNKPLVHRSRCKKDNLKNGHLELRNPGASHLGYPQHLQHLEHRIISQQNSPFLKPQHGYKAHGNAFSFHDESGQPNYAATSRRCKQRVEWDCSQMPNIKVTPFQRNSK